MVVAPFGALLMAAVCCPVVLETSATMALIAAILLVSIAVRADKETGPTIFCFTKPLSENWMRCCCYHRLELGAVDISHPMMAT
jgi:hypothetical protein